MYADAINRTLANCENMINYKLQTGIDSVIYNGNTFFLKAGTVLTQKFCQSAWNIIEYSKMLSDNKLVYTIELASPLYNLSVFPDGQIGVKLLDFSCCENFEFKINSYTDLFILKSIMQIWRRNYKGVCRVTIPCMFGQQSDRIFEQNSSFDLKTIVEFLNSCTIDVIRVFHPHSDVTPALLEMSQTCEVIDNSVFLTNVLDNVRANLQLSEEEFKQQVILMSPDAGGFKSLTKTAEIIEWNSDNVYNASKSRNHLTKEITTKVFENDFQGKHIVIVDDMCLGGKTFLQLAAALQDKNAGKLFLAVSHMIMQKPNPLLQDVFHTVYSTESKFKASEVSLRNYRTLPYLYYAKDK